MASLSLMQRGSTSITSSDTSPKDVTLSSPVKLASSLVIPKPRQRRKSLKVQRGTVTIGEAGTSPQDVTISAVVLANSRVNISVRENRDGDARGVSAKLTSTTNLRLSFYGTVDAGENIEVEWEVIEDLDPYIGVTVRILDTTHLRFTWDGTLVAGETIDVDWEVLDFDDVGDYLLEILFREQRILGYLGENIVTDDMILDDAGNVAQCRLRIFDTKAHADSCTIDLPAGSPLETGELSRAQLVQDVDISTNNREALIQTLLEVAATPGVD